MTMVTASSSSSPSAKASIATVKFICSYGGRILPRNGKLRYIGGETRVLAIQKCLPFAELQAKLRELCGRGLVSLRCQLPDDDMDTLVSITSDEDLANIYEVYDLASQDHIKIRAFLFLRGSGKPPESVVSQRCFLQLPAPSRSYINGPVGYPSSSHRQDWLGHDCPAHGNRRRPEYRLHQQWQ